MFMGRDPESADDFCLERFLQDLVEHRMVFIYIGREHPAHFRGTSVGVFVVNSFFRIIDGERAVINRAHLERLCFLPRKLAIDLDFERNIHGHLLGHFAQPIEFVIHFGRDGVVLALLGQLAGPGSSSHELILLQGDGHLCVGFRRLDGNAHQTELVPQHIGIRFLRLFLSVLRRTLGGRGNQQRWKELTIHVRFRTPFNLIRLGHRRGRDRDQKNQDRREQKFHGHHG